MIDGRTTRSTRHAWRRSAASGNPFRDEQLPQAVIALKQGVGLIRSESDRGVLVLCDPRLLNRGYGRVLSCRRSGAPAAWRCAGLLYATMGARGR